MQPESFLLQRKEGTTSAVQRAGVSLISLKTFFGKIHRFFFRLFFYQIPFVALCIIAFLYFLTGNPISEEKFKILLGAIGFAAVLSGLSFRACSTTDDKEKKIVFNHAGERLFHSALLLVISSILQYTGSNLGIPEKYKLAACLIKLVLLIPSGLFFGIGIVTTYVAIISLQKILYRDYDWVSKI